MGRSEQTKKTPLMKRGYQVLALAPRSINRTSKVSPVGAFGPLARPTMRSGRCFVRLSRRSTPELKGVPACRAHPDRLGFSCIFNPTNGSNNQVFQVVGCC